MILINTKYSPLVCRLWRCIRKMDMDIDHYKEIVLLGFKETNGEFRLTALEKLPILTFTFAVVAFGISIPLLDLKQGTLEIGSIFCFLFCWMLGLFAYLSTKRTIKITESEIVDFYPFKKTVIDKYAIAEMSVTKDAHGKIWLCINDGEPQKLLLCKTLLKEFEASFNNQSATGYRADRATRSPIDCSIYKSTAKGGLF